MLPRAHVLHLASRVGLLAWPVIITNLLQSLVNVADLAMVGRLGPIEIAAVGMGSAVRMLILVVILAVTTGSMALAAQARGAGDTSELQTVARQSMLLALAVAVVLTAVGLLAAGPVLGFLNHGGDPRATALGRDYLMLIFSGTVFLVTNVTVNALMQGAGDTLTPMLITTGVNVANVALSLVLIFGLGPVPALGVVGAALGTVMARALGSAAGVWILASGRTRVAFGRGSWRPELARLASLLRVGVPSGVQGLVRNSAQILVLRIVTSTAAGSHGAAALAVGLQVESLAFMPGLAISVAATSLVGRAVGRWDAADARRQGTAATGLAVAVMSLLAAALAALAPVLVRAFDPSAHPVVLDAGISYLRINALSHPLLAVAMVVNGALRGAGDTRPGMVGTILGRWVTVVPLAWLLAHPLGLGVQGVWWALVAGTAVSAAWVALRWRGEGWLAVARRTSALWQQHLRHLPPDEAARFLDQVKGPVMALPDAREHLAAHGVTYATAEGEVRVRFEPRPRIVEGEELLARARGA
ncbi:MAG: MATE family efflux transporter [Trueperaceae bacterium]|nr:MATE family efflux transporter [Trueperaceae bacterium]